MLYQPSLKEKLALRQQRGFIKASLLLFILLKIGGNQVGTVYLTNSAGFYPGLYLQLE